MIIINKINKRFPIAILFTTIYYLVVQNVAQAQGNNLEYIFQHCCDIGRNISVGISTCEAGGFQDAFTNIPEGQKGVCSLAINLCCTQAIKDRQCEDGKRKAKSGVTSCSFQSYIEERNMYKYCCESCKLGLIFGSITKMCELQSFRFGTPWDDVFRSCCLELSTTTRSLASSGGTRTMNMCDLIPGELCSQICIPKNGTYECRCKEGFYLTTDDKTCLKQIDDPCQKFNPCDHICINIGNNAVCFCKDGFKLSNDNRTCVDVNECQLNIHTCDDQQRCDNTIGSYQCIRFTGCGTGYTLNSQTGECEDDDECTLGIHNCDTLGSSYECKNTLGSFRCVKRHCKNRQDCAAERREMITGRTLSPKVVVTAVPPPTIVVTTAVPSRITVVPPASTRKIIYTTPRTTLNPDSCIEKNECAENPRICEHQCIDTLCSYKCACYSGYALHTDNRSCIDIDECKLFERHNLCIGICINQPGTYRCQCPDGYKLGSDSISCEDIDECQDKNVCRQKDDICLNIRGSYRCNRINCPVNYIADPDHRNRCRRAQGFCSLNTPECMKMPTMYSFNYMTFVSNIQITPNSKLNLLTVRGPTLYNSTTQFFLNLISVQAPVDVQKATEDNFRLSQSSPNEAVVSLVKPIRGPQEIELNLITRFTYEKTYEGFSISKFIIYVSKYEF